MELQLGLSLLPSGNNVNNYMEGFGSNYHNFIASSSNNDNNNVTNMINKRSFSRAFDDDSETADHHRPPPPKTLPLLWNDLPNNNNEKNRSFALIKNNEGELEEDGVVGWPPIKSRRRRFCCGGDRTVENGCGCGERVSRFMYVKVKMEGVGIARKIDLSVHACFGTLMNTLMDMFGKCHEDSENYILTYQDRKGDWLLAQDVSWRTFIRSVQRLKLLRRNDQWNH